MPTQRFQILPIDPSLPVEQQHSLLRINALGSLYQFIKVVLKRRKLTDDLHFPLCMFLERDHLNDVIEWPRDHFKTTIASEGLPMWRALPFTQQDEDNFRILGYGDDFIAYMKKMHNPETRNLVASSNVTNAIKIGRRLRGHFESNNLYRAIFPETLPDSTCVWSDQCYCIKRPSGTDAGSHGEGTFDFTGTGAALQSRHYSGIIVQDDLIGIKEAESEPLMDKAIDFHKLVSPLFEEDNPDVEGDQLVIGNRWGYNDVNSYIREHEPWYQITTHSALGGCCSAHPSDMPIMPSIFSYEKLMRKKQTLGAFKFSCQFLNNPSAPENAEFKESDLRFFRIEIPSGSVEQYLIHEVKDGIVRQRVKLSHLSKVLVTDPNHSGNAGHGRCRHAIVVVGLDAEGNYYILDSWAQAVSYPEYFNKIYEMAVKWKIKKVGFETVAAQKFAAYHLSFLNRTKPWQLRIVECKGEVQLPDGEVSKKKVWRIYNVIAPIMESGRLWVQSNFVPGGHRSYKHNDFVTELTTFTTVKGGGRYLDQLDAFAYVPQLLRVPQSGHTDSLRLLAHQQRMKQVNVPYINVN